MSMPFPPFDPDPPANGSPKARRRRTFRGVPFKMLAPNMITLLALCLGLTAIRMCIEGRYELAIFAILGAAILDGLDGRVARLLKSTSRFGAELDSLADFLNFGVAPAILLHVWLLDGLGNIGWIAGLVFAVCAALRLARFNVQLDAPRSPSWMANFFTGVPAPAGALVVLLPVYLHLVGLPYSIVGAPIVLVYELAIAFLMVSRLPTFSAKKVGDRVPREMVLPLFFAVVVAVALLISFTWQFLAVATFAYLLAIPFAVMTYRRMERRYIRGQDEVDGESTGGVPQTSATASPSEPVAVRALDEEAGR